MHTPPEREASSFLPPSDCRVRMSRGAGLRCSSPKPRATRQNRSRRTRRGNSNVFDAKWRDSLSGQGLSDLIELREVTERSVTLYRGGLKGTYHGHFSPAGTGTRGDASWYPEGAFWTAAFEDQVIAAQDLPGGRRTPLGRARSFGSVCHHSESMVDRRLRESQFGAGGPHRAVERSLLLSAGCRENATFHHPSPDRDVAQLGGVRGERVLSEDVEVGALSGRDG